VSDLFRTFATKTSCAIGSPSAFILALGLVIVWAVSGPFFGFSDTWQLIINTATTISTGLIVFLIQNTQNRDNLALHAKIDELIVHVQGARNELAGIEKADEQTFKEVVDER
jgi:low affinity Fe/Cu permease